MLINQTYDDFMFSHRIQGESNLPITHTRIGSAGTNGTSAGTTGTNSVYGGKYHIPDDEYSTFMKLYCDHVFKAGNPEYLTEKQLDSGIIAVDMDLRFAPSVKKRVYAADHIQSLITIYLGEIEKMYKFDETPFYIYVMEKPEINPIKNADTGEIDFVKDGIHLLIGINADRNVQQIL